MSRFLVPALLLLAAAAYLVGPVLDPCGSPITYRVGAIDAGFGITRNELVAALRRAEAVWEIPSGHDLFELAEDARITVNMAYDERQQRTQDNARRREEIERAATSADDLRSRYRAASNRYEAAKAAWLDDKARHERRLADYNRRVARWNASGGAAAERDALRREEGAIEAASAALEKQRLDVNALANHANTLGERYNAMARTVNDNVEAVNSTAGEEFKQGRYLRDGRGERIDIYKFGSQDDLVHVLAHEMGHALGLVHDDNPASIMYGLNSTESVIASRDDLAALRQRCGF